MAVTITKEDGTGLANANSYADLNNAEAYLENTGRKSNPAWKNASSDAKRAALIVATAFMDATFRCRWLGILVEATQDTQALDWPREGLFLPSGAVRPPDPIPPAIANGCIEYALIEVDGGISPNPTYDPTGRSVKESAVRVEGAVSKKTVFDGGTRPVTNRKYPAAEAVLREYLTPASRLLLRA
jgi:hypothetical protein